MSNRIVSVIYAVIDTNVIVSALITRRMDSPTIKVLSAIRDGRIKVVCSRDILNEYREVLSRGKFHLSTARVEQTISTLVENALFLEPVASGEEFSDETDRVFYEVALAGSEDRTRLVTGNLRHYPISPIVVTPAQMVAILETMSDLENHSP